MTSAVEQLLARLDNEDPYAYRLKDVRELQFAAVNERLQWVVDKIPVMQRRVADTETKQISSLEDIIPLFFSDKTFKSYPESFLTEGRWKALGSWLDAMSADSHTADVDVSGVRDIDDWLHRMREAGHYIYVSSGTSGKCSLYKVNDFDLEFDKRMYQKGFTWATGAKPDNSRAAFGLYPTKGFYKAMDTFGKKVIPNFCRADATYYLTDEPMLVSTTNAFAKLKRDVAAGVAKPSDITQYEELAAIREKKMRGSMTQLAEAVVRHQDEPAMFLGTWAPMYSLVKAAQALGWKGAHPDSVVFAGGGLKGIVLPPNFKEEMNAAFGLPKSRYFGVYGTAELTSYQAQCQSGRYHFAPWMIPIVVDKEGDNLIKPENNKVTGRMAFFDISLEARWGCLVTGDHVTVHLDTCPCGRDSPSVEDNIARIADLPGGDDRVSCAGTMDNYVRGLVNEKD